MILISGKSESGKDVVSDFIKKKMSTLGNSCLVVRLGDWLKFIAIKYYGWDGKDKTKNRSLLHKVSADMHKDNPDFIANSLSTFCSIVAKDYDYIVVGDLRFQNEARVLTNQFDCVIIRTERPEFKNKMTDEQRSDISEVDLDDYTFDYIISTNDIKEKRKITNLIIEEVANGNKDLR